MKTKYILSALCLPALFAACTNDDFLNESANGSSSDASTVKLTVAATYGTGDEANTKMVNKDGTFWWENTDILGAVLLKGTGSSIDDAFSTQNKFTNTLTEPSLEADFTTASTTVVGEYMFYYPYSEKYTNDLTGAKYSLPEPQFYDPNGEKMMENNFMISPRINLNGHESNELTLPLTMRSIYAYGELYLKLGDVLKIESDPLTTSLPSVNVQKITIAYNTNSEVYKDGMIDMSAVPEVNLTAEKLKALREGDNENYKGKTDEELTRILLQEADAELTQADANYEKNPLELTTGTDYINLVSISCVDEENPDGIVVSKTAPFHTRVLLPTVSSAKITVSVYTNVGVYSKEITDAKFKASHTVNLADPNRATSVEADAFTMDEFKSVDEISPVNVADFIAAVKQYQGTTPLKVTLGNFDLTPEAIAAIPENVSIELQNAASFAGDMTLKNIKLAAGVTNKVKSGVVTLESVSFQSNSEFDIEGGELVVAGTAEGNQAIYNVEGGKLTINNVAENGDANKTTVWRINANAGTVEVNTPLNLSNGFSVEKDVVVTNNSTINRINKIEKGGKLVNNGTVTVGNNEGTIDNNANTFTVRNSSLTVNTNTGVINTVAESVTNIENANNGYIYYTAGALINTKEKNPGTNEEAGNIYLVVDKAMTGAQLVEAFGNTPCTAIEVKGVALTLEAEAKGWSYSALENLHCVVLEGATVTANTELQFNQCGFFVYGNSTINGSSPLTFISGTAEDKLTVAKDAKLTIGTPINGIYDIVVNGQVDARAQVTYRGTLTDNNNGWAGVPATK